MTISKINLQDYRTQGSKVFTGRDRGIEVRESSRIDSFVAENNCIEIIVPADIRSINPSFLEEFLFNVVIKLGEEKFNDTVRFITTGRYEIDSDLREAVESILREENALTS